MSQKPPENRMHIRRCHVCNEITEREGVTVKKCAHCGKAMAPFYFFNESETEPMSDGEVRADQLTGQRRPIQGLTAYW